MNRSYFIKVHYPLSSLPVMAKGPIDIVRGKIKYFSNESLKLESVKNTSLAACEL